MDLAEKMALAESTQEAELARLLAMPTRLMQATEHLERLEQPDIKAVTTEWQEDMREAVRHLHDVLAILLVHISRQEPGPPDSP